MRRAFTWLPWILLILVIVSFLAWHKFLQPKPEVAADGVKMPAEKVEPLIDTTRSGGVVSYSAAVKVAAPLTRSGLATLAGAAAAGAASPAANDDMAGKASRAASREVANSFISGLLIGWRTELNTF